MADKFTLEGRSRIMAKVKSQNTKPEKQVRSLLHKMGYRFRLHRKDLPGKPDIVLPKFHTVIFVHGCFWHGHVGCRRSARPTSNTGFWNAKLDCNLERDSKVIEKIHSLGWKTLVIWECETRDINMLWNRLEYFFDINIEGAV